MLFLFIILITSLELSAASKLTPECKKLFAPYQPWNCCDQYPEPTLKNETVDACIEKCSGKNDDICCLRDCYYETSGVYDQGKFNIDKLGQLFDNNSEKQEIWSQVTKKSIEECEKLSNYIIC